MSSTDSKVNTLWKNTIFNKAETDINKSPSEESIVYRPAILSNQIYNSSNLIPIPAGELANISIFKTVKCVIDPTINETRTWIAVKDITKNPYDNTNRLLDWIDPSIDISYTIKLYIGDPSNNVRITSEYEYTFDYVNGIIVFMDNIPDLTDSIYITGYRYIGNKGISSGDTLVLGTPSDGSLIDTVEKTLAIKTWTSSTKITDAIDDLNEALSYFVPDPPIELQGHKLIFNTIEQIDGQDILLADNFTNNSAYHMTPGMKVSLTKRNNIVSNSIENYGNGQSGSLSLFVNNLVNIVNFDNTDKSGTYGSLIITDNSQYPLNRPPIFFRSITSHIELNNLQVGASIVELVHSETGTTGISFIVYDDLSSLPSTSNVSVSEKNVTIAYSSSIPHYNTGSVLTVNTSVKNLVGQTYLSGPIFQISSDPVIGSIVSFSPNDISISALPARMPSTNISANYTVNDNIHTQCYMIAKGKNIVGNENWKYSLTKINVMAGNPTNCIVENSIPVINMKNVGNVLNNDPAYRIVMSSGDIPVDDITNITSSNWVSMNTVAPYDAIIVGGVLKNDKTDYSICLPVGPNLVNQNDNQYASFQFHRKGISRFDINISGTYSGIWVKLSNTNWFDLTKLYGNSNGCAEGIAATGDSGIFRVNFGQYNSSNCINNTICVRIKLSIGQSITGLSFVGID